MAKKKTFRIKDLMVTVLPKHVRVAQWHCLHATVCRLPSRDADFDDYDAQDCGPPGTAITSPGGHCREGVNTLFPCDPGEATVTVWCNDITDCDGANLSYDVDCKEGETSIDPCDARVAPTNCQGVVASDDACDQGQGSDCFWGVASDCEGDGGSECPALAGSECDDEPGADGSQCPALEGSQCDDGGEGAASGCTQLDGSAGEICGITEPSACGGESAIGLNFSRVNGLDALKRELRQALKQVESFEKAKYLEVAGRTPLDEEERQRLARRVTENFTGDDR